MGRFHNWVGGLNRASRATLWFVWLLVALGLVAVVALLIDLPLRALGPNTDSGAQLVCTDASCGTVGGGAEAVTPTDRALRDLEAQGFHGDLAAELAAAHPGPLIRVSPTADGTVGGCAPGPQAPGLRWELAPGFDPFTTTPQPLKVAICPASGPCQIHHLTAANMLQVVPGLGADEPVDIAVRVGDQVHYAQLLTRPVGQARYPGQDGAPSGEDTAPTQPNMAAGAGGSAGGSAGAGGACYRALQTEAVAATLGTVSIRLGPAGIAPGANE